MTVTIERLSAADYNLSKRDPLPYVDIFALHPLYKDVAFTGNHILFGPKGLGKSLSVASFAQAIDVPIVTFDCSEDVRRSHLIGTFILRGQETPFVLGALTTAFEIAEEMGSCILVLEEINALSPQVQKILNPATDFRRKIEVPEVKRVFSLSKNKLLWIVGTMNPTVYGGVFSLNEDLKSRFRILRLDYPNEPQERKILDETFKGTKIPEQMVDGLLRLAFETRQGAFEYPLSTRDVVQILEDVTRFLQTTSPLVALTRALRFAAGKFDGDDLPTFEARVESIFAGVHLRKTHA